MQAIISIATVILGIKRSSCIRRLVEKSTKMTQETW
jgi:hypothetical protein